MKKVLISFMFIFTILFVGGANISQAASLSVSASKTNPKVGETVTVTVKFSQPVTTASFKLNYNNAVLQYSSNTIGGTNSGNSIVVDYIDLVNLKTVSSASFTFKVKTEGTSKISVSGITISDSQGNELPASAGSTTITVKKETTNNENNNNSNSGNNNNSNIGNNNNSNTGNNNSSNSGSNTNSNSNNSSKKPTFKNTNQKVYAKSEVNVRSSYSTSSNKLGTLKKGDSVTRIGTGNNGWDKVTYNGKTAYILSSYLTTTKPNEDKNTTANNEIKNEEHTQTNNTVENIENTQTNNTEVDTISNNIANGLVNDKTEKDTQKTFNYVIYTIIALIIITVIAMIIKEKRK